MSKHQSKTQIPAQESNVRYIPRNRFPFDTKPVTSQKTISSPGQHEPQDGNLGLDRVTLMIREQVPDRANSEQLNKSSSSLNAVLKKPSNAALGKIDNTEEHGREKVRKHFNKHEQKATKRETEKGF